MSLALVFAFFSLPLPLFDFLHLFFFSAHGTLCSSLCATFHNPLSCLCPTLLGDVDNASLELSSQEGSQCASAHPLSIKQSQRWTGNKAWHIEGSR